MIHLVLDTGVLGQLCHPGQERNRPAARWFADLLRNQSAAYWVFIPEIADYELRRKLLHLIRKGQATQRSIDRLDDLEKLVDYLPLDTEVMKQAAAFWAQARHEGFPMASPEAIDGDVILAAQALSVAGTIVTTNRKHLSRFVDTREWTELAG